MTKQRLLWRCLAKALACAALLGCPGPIEHGQASACGPTNCDGCCDELSVCHSGADVTAHDGGRGGRCTWCTGASTVEDAGTDAGIKDAGTDAGSCDRFNCKTGCCQNGACVQNPPMSPACFAGVACEICQSCDGGVCGPWPGCKLFNGMEPSSPIGAMINFGSRPVGTTTSSFLLLMNGGSADCQVTRLSLSPSLNSAVFSVDTLPSLTSGSVTLPPGSGSVIEVTATFKPSAVKSYLPSANTFTLETSEPSDTQCSAIPDAGCKQFSLGGTGI